MEHTSFTANTATRERIALTRESLELLLESMCEDDDFLVLDPEQPIEGCLYLQTAYTSGGYIVEARMARGDRFEHYRTFCTLEETVKTFLNFYDMALLPDLLHWENVTGEM